MIKMMLIRKIGDKADSLMAVARAAKDEIGYINVILKQLNQRDTKVRLLHETPVMQKYSIVCCDGTNLIAEFAGALVKIGDSLKSRDFYVCGYVGVKLNYLHKILQKCAMPPKSFKDRIVDTIKNRQYQ